MRVRINTRCHTNQNRLHNSVTGRDTGEAAQLMRVVDNKSANTLSNAKLDFFIGLVVAVIKDVLRWETDRQRGVELTAACDINVQAFFIHDSRNRLHQECFGCIRNSDIPLIALAEHLCVLAAVLADKGFIHDVERGSKCLCQLNCVAATDLEVTGIVDPLGS